MAIKDFIGKYKGEVLFSIKESDADGELTDLVSFDTKELEAIKEDITSKEVHKWSVEIVNYKAVITIIVKETLPSDKVEDGSADGI